MKDFIKQKLHEHWGWSEPQVISPLSKELDRIENSGYDISQIQQALEKLENNYAAKYAEYEGDSYGIIDAMKKVMPSRLVQIYTDMHPNIHNEQLMKEAEGKQFNQFVADLGAKPVDGKVGMYSFQVGPSTIYFKNSPNKNTVEFDLIHTPEIARGSGGARKTLVDWLSVVDKYGFNVEAIIAARDAKTNDAQLAKFYQSLGFHFQEMGGFESDFEIIRYKGGR